MSVDQVVNNPPPFPSTRDLLSEAWEMTKPALGQWIAGTIVLGLVCAVLACTIVGTLAVGPLSAGAFIVGLRFVRGQPISLGGFFDGFKLFLPLFLLGIVQTFLVSLGFQLLVIPGIYLSVAWVFAQMLVIDRGLDFWPALEVSRKVVHQRWFETFVFLLALGGINILGALPCYLGLLVTAPVSIVAMVLAYEKLFGVEGGAERLGG